MSHTPATHSPKKPSYAAVLVVVHGADAGRHITLGNAALELGRDTAVALTDATVMARHAEIRSESGQWVLRDLGSGGGTFVNDLRVEEYVLRDGDRIRMGRQILKLLEAGDIERRAAEELFRVQTLDGLTMLGNRDSFEAALSREVSRARRFGQGLSVVVLDVDAFRKVNSAHGEAVGNLLLQRLSQRMQGVLRRQDVVSRIEGDAFAVVLPGCEAQEARDVAERLRRVVAAEQLVTDSGTIRVTMSAGFSRLRTRDSEAELMARAFRAVGKAQASGGDRVEDASHWVPTSATEWNESASEADA